MTIQESYVSLYTFISCLHIILSGVRRYTW